MTPARAANGRTLPLLSGLLLAISFPPATLLLPPFVALVPLLVHLAGLPAGPEGRWAATRAGMLMGAVAFGLMLYWLPLALLRYSPLAIPAYLLTIAVLAGLTGLFAAGVHLGLRRVGTPLPALAAVFWTALEWGRAHLGDLAFPWLDLGTALAPYPRLAGAADLVGARGLSFWLAGVNGMVALAILRMRAARPVGRLAAGTLALVLIPVGYGVWRADSLELRPAARIALVQPNIPEELKLDPRIALDTSRVALTALTRQVEPGTVDLVVWPEVALPADLLRTEGLLLETEALAREVRAPLLAGAYGSRGSARGPASFNSAFLVDPLADPGMDGERRYDKRRLVPFVERVPFLEPALLERWTGPLGRFGGLAEGVQGPVLEAGNGAPFGVLICYESIFPGLAREYRRAGADFLVNVTNDAWYGGEAWYARTTALWQHPAHLVLRAIETRTGVARAANTGISMLVDPLGRTSHRTPLFEPALRTGTVLTTDKITLFVRWGDWVGALATAAAAVILAWGVGAALRSRY